MPIARSELQNFTASQGDGYESVPCRAGLSRHLVRGSVPPRELLLRRLEISQIRRRLILGRGHDRAVRALEIGLLADLEDALTVAAVLGPFRVFVGQAAIGLEHRP